MTLVSIYLSKPGQSPKAVLRGITPREAHKALQNAASELESPIRYRDRNRLVAENGNSLYVQ